MITVDTHDFKRLERDLVRFARKAIPFAARDFVNSAAFGAQKEWRGQIDKAFTLRNHFTVRSVQVDKANGIDIRTMHSVVGSVAPYMGDQEDGATIRGKGQHKAIPGPAAAGHRPGAGKRTRTVRGKYKLSAISVAEPPGGGLGKRRRNAVAIAVAMRRGQKFVLLHRKRGGGRGLFEVLPSKGLARTKLLWDVSRSSVRVKPSHTLGTALKQMDSHLDRLQMESIVRQLKRHKVFGY